MGRKPAKRRRLPNGFGQISEIKTGNLRNRFRAMITVGKTEYGRPIVKPLKPVSYFETYNDAYAALLEYNRGSRGYDDEMTVEELYNEWFPEYKKKVSKSSYSNVEISWKYCSKLYGVYVSELKSRQVKECMYNSYAIVKDQKISPTPNRSLFIKLLFTMMLDYAVENDYIENNCARKVKYVKPESTEKIIHQPYTEEEVQLMWDHLNVPLVDMILIQCYSGWRPKELFQLSIDNIDFEKNIMTGGVKIKAGKNRIVPIHNKIKPLLQKRYDICVKNNTKYIFNEKNKELSYSTFKIRYDKMQKKLGMSKHYGHDGRLFFATQAKKHKLDEYAIKYIMGHQIDDVTENVYTKREISWLDSEMQKIK